MSTPLLCPSASAGSGKSGRAASCVKLLASHQCQVQQARLLAVVDQSHAPINKSRDPDPTALVTPSSVDHVNCYSQRCAKKLLKQVKVTVAVRMMSLITELSPIPKLPPLVEQVLGSAHIMGGGERT
jgi:hypothetical protein